MRQLVIASEYGEPSKHEGLICQRLFNRKSLEGRDICLLLITKNLPECLEILGTAEELEIPIQVHCTITGLGNTPIEPHIPFPDYVLEQSIEVIRKYKIAPEAVTVRVDPLIPELLDKQMNVIPHILETFANVGVKDCRISIVDYYPHVRARFDKLGVEHPNRFQPLDSAKDLAINKMFHLTCKFNMNLHLCAELVPQSLKSSTNIDIDTEGCASAASWKRLGIAKLKPATRKQRRECTCDLEKVDLLAGLSKGCKQGCAYCYWR